MPAASTAQTHPSRPVGACGAALRHAAARCNACCTQLQHCLPRAQVAVSFLLERSGDYTAALSTLLAELSEKMKNLQIATASAAPVDDASANEAEASRQVEEALSAARPAAALPIAAHPSVGGAGGACPTPIGQRTRWRGCDRVRRSEQSRCV